MANEGEIVVLGIVIAIAGFLLIVSPVIDNLAVGLFKINEDKLQGLSILFLLGGITLAVVAGVSANKKSSK